MQNQVRMLGKWISVEKIKQNDNKTAALFAMPDDASAVGIVRGVGPELNESAIKVGQKVYFGKNRHELKMNGVDVYVMELTNIYAIAE